MKPLSKSGNKYTEKYVVSGQNGRLRQSWRLCFFAISPNYLLVEKLFQCVMSYFTYCKTAFKTREERSHLTHP